MGTHARLAPSNHRWPNCPASVEVEKNYPDIPTKAAIDGTGTHLLLEHALALNRRKVDYRKLLGSTIGEGHVDCPNGWKVTEDRLDRVGYAIDYVNRRIQELTEKYPGCQVILQSEYSTNPGTRYGRDDWYGTTDILIEVLKNFSRFEYQYFEVIDFKDGVGFVSVEDNSQLLSYLGGRAALFPAKDIDCRMTIIQPKTNPVIRYSDVTSRFVVSRCDDLAQRAKLTDAIDAAFIPDNKQGKGYCRWCKHRQNCKALNEKIAQGGDDLKTREQIDSMTVSELSEYIALESAARDAFDYAKTRGVELIKQGKQLPGFELVSRSNRVWVDSDNVIISKLRDRFGKEEVQNYLSLELKSPAKILDKDPDLHDKIEDLIVLKPTKPFLKVKEEKNPEVAQLFADVLAQKPVLNFDLL